MTLTYIKICDIMCIFKIFNEYGMFRGHVGPPQFFQFVFFIVRYNTNVIKLKVKYNFTL